MGILPKDGRDDRTLYQQLRELKGAEVINAVVTQLYRRIYNDAVLRGYFVDVSRPALEKKMVVFLVSALDHGEWEGRNLAAVHQPYQIPVAHFDRVFTHLVEILEANGVPQGIIVQIGDVLAPLRVQICVDAGRH